MDLREKLLALDCELGKARYNPQERVLELAREIQSLPDLNRVALVQLVQDADPVLSAAVLECLVQDPSDSATASLADLIANASGTEAWFDQALLAALRKPIHGVARIARDYVEKHRSASGFALALLTHLPHVAPRDGVRIGVEFLCERLATASDFEAEALSQAFVNGYLTGDPDLLAELVHKTLQRDLSLGRRLGLAVTETLGKPWIVRRIGQASSDSLVQQVRSILA